MIDEAKLAELKAAHGGRLIEIESKGQTFAFRYPTRAEVKMFHQTGKRDPETAGENMMFQCVVFPDHVALSAFFELYPFAPGPFFQAISKAAGLSDDGELVVK